MRNFCVCMRPVTSMLSQSKYVLNTTQHSQQYSTRSRTQYEIRFIVIADRNRWNLIASRGRKNHILRARKRDTTCRIKYMIYQIILLSTWLRFLFTETTLVWKLFLLFKKWWQRQYFQKVHKTINIGQHLLLITSYEKCICFVIFR